MRVEDDAVRDYLRRLDDALRELPSHRRREIVEEVEQHIREATADRHSEASVREVLDRLGDPEEIAAEAGAPAPRVRRRLGALEVAAIALLLVGGFFPPLLGWVVGVVLLWLSDAWTKGQKLIATFVVPGGLALPLFLSTFALATSASCVLVTSPGGRTVERCSDGGAVSYLIPIFVLGGLALASIATAVYLGRSAHKRHA